MKKFLLIIISAFFLTACGSVQAEKAEKTETETRQDSPAPPLSVEKGGVTVEIQDIRKENGKTAISILMDNHAYDLSAMEVLNLSSLNGVKAESYQIKETFMGGHHVSAEIIFPGQLSGLLTIGLNDDLIFDFEIS